jgi:hypothetical protein
MRLGARAICATANVPYGPPIIRATGTQTFAQDGFRMALLMAVRQSAPGGLTLRGRRGECAALDRLLQGALAGRSAVLVVRDEAGVGKTALLDYAIRSASDTLVVRASGVESEMELAFGRCISCAPRCSIALRDFPLLSAMRWRSPPWGSRSAPFCRYAPYSSLIVWQVE